MSSPFPFRTRLGRLLDHLSANERLQPYIAPARRLLRKLWVAAAANPTLRAMSRYVTPLRIAALASLLIAAAFGFLVAHEIEVVHKRRVYADVRRVSNLEQIRLDIRQFHLKRGHLPSSLKELQSDNSNPAYVRDDRFYDPESFEPMIYRLTSPDGYSLCAAFHFNSRIIAAEVPDSGADGPVWRHEPGYHCFEFAVATNQSSPETP